MVASLKEQVTQSKSKYVYAVDDITQLEGEVTDDIAKRRIEIMTKYIEDVKN